MRFHLYYNRYRLVNVLSVSAGIWLSMSGIARQDLPLFPHNVSTREGGSSSDEHLHDQAIVRKIAACGSPSLYRPVRNGLLNRHDSSLPSDLQPDPQLPTMKTHLRIKLLALTLLVGWITFTACAATMLSGEDALTALKDGNTRYIAGKPIHPNQDAARRTTVAKGQNPFATVLTCSDSRVPVELLFDQGLGDTFVVRVAGNVSDTDEVGSIEYGVGHLNTPLLVVMGHTSCGAVKAVLEGLQVHGSIPALVDNITPAIAQAK